MAYELNNLCEKTDLTQSQKTVFSKLCDHASKGPDGHYRCWPSIKTLSWKIGRSERTVSRAIKYLKDNQYIFIYKTIWKKGGYPGNLYTINMQKIILESRLRDHSPPQDYTL